MRNILIILFFALLGIESNAAFSALGATNINYGTIDYLKAPHVLLNFKNAGSATDSLSSPSLPSSYEVSVNRCQNIKPNRTCYLIIKPKISIQPSDTQLSFSLMGFNISMNLYIFNERTQTLDIPSSVSLNPDFLFKLNSIPDVSFITSDTNKFVQVDLKNIGFSSGTPDISFDSNLADAKIIINRCQNVAPKKTCYVMISIPKLANDQVISQSLKISLSSVEKDALAFNIKGPVTIVPGTFSSSLKSPDLTLSVDKKTVSTSSAPVISWVYLDKYVSTSSGKYYIEIESNLAYYSYIGGNFLNSDPTVFYDAGWPFYLSGGYKGFYQHQSEGNLYENTGSHVVGTGLNWGGANRRIMVAIDFDLQRAWTGVNGVWGSGNPATGTGGVSLTASQPYGSRFYFSIGLSGGSFTLIDSPLYKPVGFNQLN